jgi:hypothetical protein
VAASKDDDIDSVDGVDDARLDRQRWVVDVGFFKAWGQLVTKPDGLLRTVGRTSLNEVYALVRFNALDE